MVEYSDFRRKTEVSTPLLYYRASLERPEVWRPERSGERQSSGSALPIEASLSASQRDTERTNVLPSVWVRKLGFRR